MAVIRTVVNRSVVWPLQIPVVKTAVERAIQKFLAEPQITNNEATRTTNLQAFMVPVVKFLKNKVEMRSLERPTWINTGMYQKGNCGSKDIGGRRIPATEDGLGEIPESPDGYIRLEKDEPEGVQYVYDFG